MYIRFGHIDFINIHSTKTSPSYDEIILKFVRNSLTLIGCFWVVLKHTQSSKEQSLFYPFYRRQILRLRDIKCNNTYLAQ